MNRWCNWYPVRVVRYWRYTSWRELLRRPLPAYV